MTGPVITFRQAKDAGACAGGYRRVADHVGPHTPDTPVPVTVVLDVGGVDDAVWCLDVLGEHRLLRQFAADCAEHVAHLHGHHPACMTAIRVARLHARGLASDAELSAARAAAGDAARSAAGDAAWAGESAWQTQHLHHLLTREAWS